MLRSRHSFAIALLLSICLIVPIVASDEVVSNNENISDKSPVTDIIPVNTSDSTNETLNLTTPDELENTLGLKGPKEHITFAPESPGTDTDQDPGSPDANLSQNSTKAISDNVIANNSSTSEYLSLGDIIKAKDWKALGEYNCKIRAENSELLKDTEIGSSDKQAKWDSYFNPPEPVVYYPCCNG
jgi:hypothetical protein